MRLQFLSSVAVVVAMSLVGGVARAQTVVPHDATSVTKNDTLARGKYLAAAGDCVVCHTKEGGPSFAGGRPLQTPFGVIYSANITPDKQTGIGNWSRDDFYRAMHDGVARDGSRLYPAFPYPEFTKATPDDVEAIRTYLLSLPAIPNQPPKNELPWPLSWRALMRGWNMLFFEPGTFQPDSAKSAEWNRGAYLVEGLGHCGACHTPRNFLGAEKTGDAFAGNPLPDRTGNRVVDWNAPDLRSDSGGGLAGWNVDEVAMFLKTGRSQSHGGVFGPMDLVVEHGTQHLSDADAHAIAVYIKSLPGSGTSEAMAAATLPAGEERSGRALFTDNCATCHQSNGAGVQAAFPPLKQSAILAAKDPTNTIQIILRGSSQVTPKDTSEIFGMPAYADKLSDRDVADLTDYIRNSWGNHAAPIGPDEVHKLPLKKRQGEVETFDARIPIAFSPNEMTTPHGLDLAAGTA